MKMAQILRRQDQEGNLGDKYPALRALLAGEAPTGAGKKRLAAFPPELRFAAMMPHLGGKPGKYEAIESAAAGKRPIDAEVAREIAQLISNDHNHGFFTNGRTLSGLSPPGTTPYRIPEQLDYLLAG